MALLLLVWRQVESIVPDNVDRLEPVVRRSPSVTSTDGTHRETYGGDQFGFSLALHPTEEIAENDTPQQAAAKTRCDDLYNTRAHS